ARRSEIQALTASAQGWFASFHRLDALLEAIRARQKLDQLQNPDPALRREVDDVLHKIIFGINEVNRLSGHQGAIRAVAYRPDGEQIASASADGTLKLWQPDGTLLTTLSGHDRRADAIAFSPGGDRCFQGGATTVSKSGIPGRGMSYSTGRAALGLLVWPSAPKAICWPRGISMGRSNFGDQMARWSARSRAMGRWCDRWPLIRMARFWSLPAPTALSKSGIPRGMPMA
ncbi:MAG: hypothetical protein HC812_19840, partial [Leptolyngbya sp. RL_3_1]|nr:hypothetical protein [Leptolyngbya sp. RL_3_1]